MISLNGETHVVQLVRWEDLWVDAFLASLPFHGNFILRDETPSVRMYCLGIFSFFFFFSLFEMTMTGELGNLCDGSR